jgi:hypothetical protein
MKLVALLAGFLIAGFGSCSLKAQTLNSPNLIGSPYSTITGTIPYTGAGGGVSGGSTPGYNSTTNTIHFGYTQSIAAYTYAFNQALQNSGMTILGYNYSWSYLNQGDSEGTLSAKVNFAGTDGTSLHLKTWDLGTTTDWTKISGTENFANNGMAVSSIANFSLSFTGKDKKYWAGYYGPQVKDPSLSLNYTFDQCSSNPLSSPTCPGYAAAYLTQQCTANALYNTSCPGYAAAYQIQQCTINPLNDPSCPGYAAAYLTSQCRANQLYSSVCEGYQTAYKTQQCTATPLYATDCPGYAQAYLDDQCIKDSLFSRDCKGYATAYAIKYLVTGIDSTVVNQSLSNTAATKANDPTTVKVATNTATTTVSSDGTVSTGVSTTGDTNVDKAITSKASTTNATPTAVQLAPPPPAPAQQMSQNEPRGGNKQEDKKDDAPKGTGGNSPPPNINTTQASSDRPAAPTVRQAIQERREAAAKAEAVEKGKNLANEMGKASDMESQKAVQNVVIQAMGFTPGFDAYSRQMIVQQQFYPVVSVYNNQKNIDNRYTARMFGGNDRLHNEMVEKQYESK